MNKKCSNCHLINFPTAVSCTRCDADLVETASIAKAPRARGKSILVRGVICFCVCGFVLFGFYLSLLASAKSLTLDEKTAVRRAIAKLNEKGFAREALILDNFTAFRSSDNWLNASVAKENAYAATNFPFEIMTLYSDFFTYPADDTERAAILLHEARHLLGENEKEAYEFVWRNRKPVGWTNDKYVNSVVWMNIRKQTKDNVPNLFVCDFNALGDCTE